MIDATGLDLGSTPSTYGRSSSPTSEQFLQLLVQQLQHQDPLNPISDQNFTAQLAQFSSLEQLAQINQNLVGIGAGQESLVNSQALNLLGKTVLVTGIDQVRLSAGSSERIYVEAAEGATAHVKIKNAAGEVVRTLDVAAGSGRRQVAWDGKDDAGHPLADGTYTVEVAATDASGNQAAARLLLALSVTGVSFAGGSLGLMAGDRTLSFDQILEIQSL